LISCSAKAEGGSQAGKADEELSPESKRLSVSASSPVSPIAAPATTYLRNMLLRNTNPERLETRTTNEEASEGPQRESDY